MVIYLISRFSNWLFFPRVFLYCFLQPGWCSFRSLHTLNILTYFKYLSGFPTLHGSIGLSPVMFHSINYHLWWCMSCTSLFHLIFHGLYFQRTVSSLHSPRGAGVLWGHFGFASAQAPQTALAMNHSLGPWAELLYHTGCSIWILDQPPHTFVVRVSHQLLFSPCLRGGCELLASRLRHCSPSSQKGQVFASCLLVSFCHFWACVPEPHIWRWGRVQLV